MKYNNIVSIFLLIVVVIISQSIHVYTHPKIIEGWWFFNRNWWRRRDDRAEKAARKREEDRKRAAAAAEAALRNRFRSDSPFVNLLGEEYLLNRTAENERAFNEALEVYRSISSTIICQNDTDISEIIKKASEMLNDPNKQNSTKVFFISEILNKSLSIISTKQKNFLLIHFPISMKDDDKVTNKHSLFQNLLGLVEAARFITSDTFAFPGRDEFVFLSQDMITEAKNTINQLMNIKYTLTAAEQKEYEQKYSTNCNI
jgi:hypothetical protein